MQLTSPASGNANTTSVLMLLLNTSMCVEVTDEIAGGDFPAQKLYLFPVQPRPHNAKTIESLLHHLTATEAKELSIHRASTAWTAAVLMSLHKSPPHHDLERHERLIHISRTHTGHRNNGRGKAILTYLLLRETAGAAQFNSS